MSRRGNRTATPAPAPVDPKPEVKEPDAPAAEPTPEVKEEPDAPADAPVEQKHDDPLDAGKDAEELAKTPDEPAPPQEQVAAPGEAKAKEGYLRVRATGPHMVYDPYTQEYVGRDGGEMRATEFVHYKIAEGMLETF